MSSNVTPRAAESLAGGRAPSEPTQATAEAAANIAFIKYWGAEDLERAIPKNPSISMTLRECSSRCAVEYRPEAGVDEILLAPATRSGGAEGAATAGAPEPAPAAFAGRIQAHLDRLRELVEAPGRFRVVTRNSFPAAAGLASSASGFAALTLAVCRSLGIEASDGELSLLARSSGSGSAARSVMGGYVEWPSQGAEGPARQLAPASAWDLRDVIGIVQTEPKKVSSLDGHRRAATSPYYRRRQECLPARLEAVRNALRERDIETLGLVIEEDAIDLHLIAMSSRPPIFYWQPATLAVLEAVRDLRQEGCSAFSTMDAGANVHVICSPEDEEEVALRLARIPGVVDVIRDGVGEGPTVTRGFDL